MKTNEKLNRSTHLAGAILALIGMVILIIIGAFSKDPWRIVSFSIYGPCLFLMYLTSTLYHYFKVGKVKQVFQILDHQAIYLLIAGSYTPFTFITLNGGWGWSLFGVIWALAIFGIIWDGIFYKSKRYVPMILYVLMGWLSVLAIKPLFNNLGPRGFSLLVAGGISYTLGIVFYQLDEKYSWAHAVWHLFVLGGSFCHYLTIFVYVA